jgi:hypothetical protein
VQHESQPLGRRQRVEHQQQRRADGVGQHGPLLGAVVVGEGFRQVGRILGAGAAGPQHVQADPGHHGGEPAGEVGDVRGVAAAEAHPGLLHGVLGLVGGAEDAPGHGTQVRPVGLEPVRQGIRHVVTLLRRHPSG